MSHIFSIQFLAKYTFKKHIYNRRSMLRSRDKWLFVFWLLWDVFLTRIFVTSKIFGYFWQGFRTLVSWKFLEQFQKTFGGPKVLFFSKTFWQSKDRESQKTGKVERPKISGQCIALLCTSSVPKKVPLD